MTPLLPQHRPFARLLVVLALCIGTPGCFWAAVGGAAGGGYYVGQDERSVGQITRDAAITAELNAKLVKDGEVKAMRIDVDTRSGVVRMTGNVPSASARERVIRYARGITGVQKVETDLRVVAQ